MADHTSGVLASAASSGKERADGLIAKLDYLTAHIADHWQRDWKGDTVMRAQNAVELDMLRQEIRAGINAACGVAVVGGKTIDR